jgi:hypothetical protein
MAAFNELELHEQASVIHGLMSLQGSYEKYVALQTDEEKQQFLTDYGDGIKLDAFNELPIHEKASAIHRMLIYRGLLQRGLVSAHGKYITYNKASRKYRVQVTKDGKPHHVGLFPTQEEAVDAREAYLRGETVIKPAVKEGAHGKYISYHKASSKYVVSVRKDGKTKHVGLFPTQEEALVTRDAYLRGRQSSFHLLLEISGIASSAIQSSSSSSVVV